MHRPEVTVSSIPLGYVPEWSGEGDDVAAGTPGGGVRFHLKSSVVEEKSAEWQYVSHVLIAGGAGQIKNCGDDDSIGYVISAPSSSPAATENPGAGAFAKVPTPYGNVFVPAPGGDWDLDLEAKLNANVSFTLAVPVPVGDPESPSGVFDYDTDTDTLSVNPDGQGKFNLFDAEIPLQSYLRGVGIPGSGPQDFSPPQSNARRLLAHWTHKLTWDHTEAADAAVAGRILLARKSG